jgi:hypothetical protein
MQSPSFFFASLLRAASLLSRFAIVDTGEFGIDKLPVGSMIYVVHA